MYARLDLDLLHKCGVYRQRAVSVIEAAEKLVALGFPAGDVVYGLLNNSRLLDVVKNGHLTEGVTILRDEVDAGLCKLLTYNLEIRKLWEMRDAGLATLELLENLGWIRYLDVAIRESSIAALPKLAEDLKRANCIPYLFFAPITVPVGADPEIFKKSWIQVLQQQLKSINA